MKKIISVLIISFINLQAGEVYATLIVEAFQKANLAFDTSGIVNKVNSDISTIVKTGAVLAELQNDDLEASLRIAKATVDEAKVTLKFTKRDYERQIKVKHLIDEAKFDVYALAYEKSKVALNQAQANLAYQQSLLNKTKLRAPFNGVIYEKSIEVGDAVSGMMLRTVFKIQSLSKRKLILSFDQKYWKDVQVGQEFNYQIDGDIKKHKGVISKVYPSANAKNRKIRAEVKADEFVVGLIGAGYIIIPDKQ